MKPSRTSAGRRASYAARNQPISMAVDLSAFDDMLAGVEDDVDAALRPAVQAGADVIYRAVLRNVEAIGSVTGNLHASIYQAFVAKESKQTEGGYSKVTYDVSWNPKKAPHAHLIEYGHIQKYKVVLSKKTGHWITLKNSPLATPKQIAARPFMRPAFNRQAEAVAAVEARFWEEMGTP